jgi:hypothetical protein
MCTPNASIRLVTGYYGATVIFIILDYLLNFNIRLSFLDAWPGWRALYYGICLCLFGIMLWRPLWSRHIAAAESLLTLSLLIISTAARVMIVTDEMIEEGRGFVSVNELLNFVIAGTITYFSLMQGVLGEKRKFRY